ncbi:hypothetical protein EJB05_55037, partial [Eragrostis curvula]
MEPTRVAAADEHEDARHELLWREIRESYAANIRFGLEGLANIHAAKERENQLFRGVPASAKAILGLREPTSDEAMELQDDCPVCLDEFKEGDTLRMMPCSHCFHIRCIYKWLRASGVCPCCRFKLPTEEEQRLLDEQEAAFLQQPASGE